MKKFKYVSSRFAALSICGLFLTGLVAQADTVPITGGITSVALDSSTVTTLSGAGVSLGLIGSASLTGLTASFPITGGFINTTADQALINHDGSGLSFTDSKGTLDLENFVINVDLGTSLGTLSGEAIFGSTTIASVPIFDIGKGLNLTLTTQAADALSAVLGLPNLTGAEIGVASTSPTTTPEPASLLLLGIGLSLVGGGWIKRSTRGAGH